MHNKDGKYAWRPFRLIHPALYVLLVHAITEEENWELIRNRFQQFAENDKIRCLSFPVVSSSDERDTAEQVSHWWYDVEQRSIELSLDYDYLIETDITDCYGAIYTHSIAWALHDRDVAKKKRKDQSLIGNVIDRHIQDMCHGQTNGILQGSVLMDFIAEMVLGLADFELSDRIKKAGIEDYKILRYRDDYRVFVNSPEIGDKIVKLITETLSELGLKLNAAKTKDSNQVVRSAIKSDKLAWMAKKQSEKSLQKYLLIIHEHAVQFPNAGSLVVALNDFYKRISNKKVRKQLMPLVAITVDIAYRNPRTYPFCAAILSKLMSFIESGDAKITVAEKIKKKFDKIPNTGHMEIWIQRLTLPFAPNFSYNERMCKLVAYSGPYFQDSGLSCALS